jgi:ParB-like chromosome segregation protein Spo0J
MQNLEPHELALQLSPMDEETFASLVEDMKTGKVLEPIILYEGKILDGWHRYKAAKRAGKPFKTVEFDGDDPLLFVWQKNGLRRHWSQTDKALNYVKLMNFGKTWVGNGKHPRVGEATNADAAKAAGTSETTIGKAKTVLENAPEAAAAYEARQITAEDAEKIASKASKAKTPRQKKAIIEGGIKKASAKKAGQKKPKKPKESKSFDKYQSVRKILDALDAQKKLLGEWLEALDAGNYTPEAAAFVGRAMHKHAQAVTATGSKFIAYGEREMPK